MGIAAKAIPTIYILKFNIKNPYQTFVLWQLLFHLK
jgi:hypothetical protein